MIIDKMNNLDDFSFSEQDIINYFLNHSDAINMTIDKLAKVTYTSNSTIIRLCRKLGYKGYKDFKIDYIKELESKKYLHETVDFSSPIYAMQNTNEIISNMGSLYKDSVDLCMSMIDSKSIEKIVNRMLVSKRIFIYATGDTMITAQAFMNKIAKLNIYPILASLNQEALATSYNASKDDCALFISYSGSSNINDECVRALNKNGVDIIAITANQNSLMYKYSNYRLLLVDKEASNKIATFYSQFVFEYVLNIIYSLIYVQDYHNNNQHKQLINSVLNKE